jgi:hypothetical protein
MVDYKLLLQRHSAALFSLNDALISLAYDTVNIGRPSIHYILGNEIFWNHKAPSSAALAIIWGGGEHCQSLVLRTGDHAPRLTKPSTSNLPTPPQDILAKAVQLLQELNTKRELLELYKLGRFEDDKFILGQVVPLPEGCEKFESPYCSGATYTVTRDGVLGLDRPYTDERILYVLLGVYSYNSHNNQI